jgi:hypothetical protein
MRLLGRGRMYASRAARDEGMRAVMENAGMAGVEG